MTLMFRVTDFERAAFKAYVKEHPDQWRSVHGLWDLIRKATESGELQLSREDMLFFATPHEKEISVNSTRVTNVLGTDVWDLSYAEWESRRRISVYMTANEPPPGLMDNERAYVDCLRAACGAE